MGDTSKQVRVDNWGTFFLQRLQLFFNKTDYCDLTLQFEGNVQLKVHRLVINACTEYFRLLEQTCDVVDDILIMPPDLQADVVVPIVNFMYTGMLEFQTSMFDKLYKTAELMNITVLTKLLDAQKKPLSIAQRSIKKPQLSEQHIVRKFNSKPSSHLPATLPGRKLPVWKRKVAPAPPSNSLGSHYFTELRRPIQQDPLSLQDNTPKPTRFEWPEEDLTTLNPLDSTFDDISYTSRPLLTQEDEMRACSAFDEVKYSSTFNNGSVDQEEHGGGSILPDYEEDTEEQYVSANRSAMKRKSDMQSGTPNKRVHFIVSDKENKETKINITPTGKTPTDVNHTKIISELLKKYPHLVKKNKNIRLKIMAKNPKSTSSDQNKTVKTSFSKVKVQMSPTKPVVNKVVVESNKKEDGPWVCHKCNNPNDPAVFVLYYLYRKHMTDVHNEKFDSRMCKYCGHKSIKHNMLMYHMYTKHGVKPPPAYNFPKCNQCHYVALTEALLVKHKLNHTKHELRCPECKIAFNSEYSLTSHIQITGHSGKAGHNSFDCQYCTKHYQSGANLFSHIKMQHRDEARRDGIVSIDEIEETENAEDEQEVREEDRYITPDIIQERSREKVKILSNVKVSNTETQQEETALEVSSEAEALNNVATGIATSLGLVDIVVLDDNQQYILRSNEPHLISQQDLQDTHQEFILPELDPSQAYTQNQEILSQNSSLSSDHGVMINTSDIGSTDELVMVLTDHDYGDGNNELITNDNSNIVVLYSHPVDGQEDQFITSQSNLMVNSQTGMIEIHNSPAVSTTHSDIINGTQETPIESIEMIQQEINSHSNGIKQEEVAYETGQPMVDSSEQLTNMTEEDNQHVNLNSIDNDSEQTSQNFETEAQVEYNNLKFVDSVDEGNSNVTTASVSGDMVESESQIVPCGEESVMETENEHTDQNAAVQSMNQTDQSATDQDEENSANEITEDNIALGSAVPEKELADHVENEENQLEHTTHVDNETPVPLLSQKDDTLTDQEMDVTMNSSEPVSEERYSELQEHFELEAAEAQNSFETNEENDGNVQYEGSNSGIASQEVTGDSEIESQQLDQNGSSDASNQDHSVGQSELIQYENESSCSTQASQDSSTVQPVAAKDAKTSTKIAILDDWEDTDSQQSTEHGKASRVGNTVNKLIDDWADEEDDDKKNSV